MTSVIEVRPAGSNAPLQARLARLPVLSRARVSRAYAQVAIDVARERGADLDLLARRSGIRGIKSDSPDTFGVENYIALLGEAADMLSDPVFGLRLGLQMGIRSAIGYDMVMRSCANFRQAAIQTERFESLAHDLGRSELVVDGGTGCVNWHSPWLGVAHSRHLTESVAASFRSSIDWLAGVQLPAFEFGLPHERPPDVPAKLYEELLAAPVRFGTSVSYGRFPAQFLDFPIPGADSSQFKADLLGAELRLASQGAGAPSHELISRLRLIIRSQLMHDAARLQDIALAVKQSPRSLQRHLEQLGTSYGELLGTTRCELAKEYLSDPRLSLTDIAMLLGYSHQSNFTQAFRSWLGVPPKTWRAKFAGGSGTRP